jgi:alkylated DNA nucleotide flippase Atl1
MRAQDAPPLAEDDDAGPPDLGSRQQQAYAVLSSAGDEGKITADIAREMDYDFSNAYMTLRRLEQLNLAELIAGSKPQRWRLNPRQRGSAAPYLLAAQQIGPGEWVTYGDISVALRGDDRAARAVGRAAATIPTFPNPHRVLMAGGVVPPDWHDSNGRGPDECRRRLEAEGVKFTDGKADSNTRVTWEELRERLRAVGASVPPRADHQQ